MEQKLDLFSQAPLSISALIINLGLGVVLSLLLRWHFKHFGSTLSNRDEFSQVCPFILLTTILIITVVKSSLALSLGLVGALSIVRFRTPIKEPEELVYLFLAIALGLGYAAGYTLMTTAIMSLILLIIYLWLSNVKVNQTLEYNLVITWGKETLPFERISDEVSNVVESLKLVRLERSSESNTAVLLVSPNQNTKLDDLINQLTDLDDQISVSFYEAKANW